MCVSMDVGEQRRRIVKRILGALSACVLVAGLVASPAAASIVYQTTLSPDNESPPATGSLGTGFAQVTIDMDLLTMRVQASFSDLMGTTTAAHIHCCLVPGGPANVGVATTTPLFPGFPTGVTSGTYDMTFDLTQASTYNPAFVTANTDVTGAMNALLTGLADNATYFNIHTTSFPSGEIRGFLTAPEPQSLSLLAALGLGAALALRRRA
jgi:MYXO-CTERM domain-containing protein